MKRSTKILTRGVDPIIVQLRTEQVRQEVSNYALAKATGVDPPSITGLWNGRRGNPNLKTIRRILDYLRRPESYGGNPGFALIDHGKSSPESSPSKK